MRRQIAAVVSGITVFTTFVLLPVLVLRYLPPDILQTIRSSGIQVQSNINHLVVIGVFLTLVTILKGFVEIGSLAYLVSGVISSGMTLLVTIIFLGWGKIHSLGMPSFTTRVEGATINVSMDMRVFIYVAFIVTILRVVKTILEWNEARRVVNASPT